MRNLKKVLAITGLMCGIFLGVRSQDASAQVNNLKQINATNNTITVSWDVNGKEKYNVSLTSGNTVVYNETKSASTATSCYISGAGIAPGKSYTLTVDGTSIEVVTAPSTVGMNVEQTSATTNSVTAKITPISGANLYLLASVSGSYTDGTVYGMSSNEVVSSSIPLTPGTSARMYGYACRKSSTGFVAYEKSYKGAYFKTLMNSLPTSDFGISSAWINIDSYRFNIISSGSYTYDGWELQLINSKNKTVKTFNSTSNYGISTALNGTFYQYRVRTYVECGANKLYSAWSAKKYIAVSKSVKYIARKRSIKFSWKKINGVSGYDVYISKSENTGFKKVKSLSKKKSVIVVKKIGKKRLKKGTKYYFRIIPKAKIGKKTIKAQNYGSYYGYTRSY